VAFFVRVKAISAPNLLSEGLVIHPEDILSNSESPEETQD